MTSPFPKDLRLPQNKQGSIFNLPIHYKTSDYRAAMFLIPILGINFLLLPFRPSVGSSLEYFYDIVSTIFSSFQGAIYSNFNWIATFWCFQEYWWVASFASWMVRSDQLLSQNFSAFSQSHTKGQVWKWLQDRMNESVNVYLVRSGPHVW